MLQDNFWAHQLIFVKFDKRVHTYVKKKELYTFYQLRVFLFWLFTLFLFLLDSSFWKFSFYTSYNDFSYILFPSLYSAFINIQYISIFVHNCSLFISYLSKETFYWFFILFSCLAYFFLFSFVILNFSTDISKLVFSCLCRLSIHTVSQAWIHLLSLIHI